MQFAVFTVSQPECSPEEALDQLVRLGYEGVEWRITVDREETESPGFWRGNRATLQADWSEERFSQIADRMRSAGLHCPNLGTYLSFSDLDEIDRMMKIARLFGAPSIRVGVPRYDGSRPYPELFQQTVTGLEQVAELAEKHGVRALIEIHHGNLTPSASAAFRLVSHFRPEHVGVIHDAGNMVHEGYENYQMGCELLGPYLAHVHVKNAAWVQEPGEPPQPVRWRVVWAPLREGVVDLRVLFRSLKRAGYNGWISVEDFTTYRPQEERLADNLAVLREIDAATG